jgi:hypothetical protein
MNLSFFSEQTATKKLKRKRKEKNYFKLQKLKNGAAAGACCPMEDGAGGAR